MIDDNRVMIDRFEQLWDIIVLTLQVSGTAVFLSTAIGVPLGVWTGLNEFRGKYFAIGLIHTGMALPPVVVGLVLYLVLSRSGPFSTLGWLFTPLAMILAQTILALPFVMGITVSAVASVPRELLWQLRLLGATPRQANMAVVREARAGILLAVSTALGRSVSEVGAVWLVGGNIAGHTRVLTTAIVLETGQGHFAFALILGGVLLAIALAANLVILWHHGRTLK